MNVKELLNLDQTLHLISDHSMDNRFLGIMDADSFKEDHLFFVKNKNFLKDALSFDLKKIGIIIDAKFFNLLNESDVAKLKDAKLLLTAKDVMLVMCKASKIFYEKEFLETDNIVDGRQLGTVEIDPTSLIAQGVFIGSNVKIGANVKIFSGVCIQSNVDIGDNSIIFNNVTIYSKTKIGNNVRIHAGTVIGADGFGYHFANGAHQKIWHMGGVVINDNVEIGANSCVDMGTFSPTIIGSGCKLDNNVQVGHNVKLGTGVVLCGHTAVGGSTVIGDFTVAGGQSGFSNGVTVGAQVQVAGRAGVVSNVTDKQTVAGFPARDLKEWLKAEATLRKIALAKKEGKDETK